MRGNWEQTEPLSLAPEQHKHLESQQEKQSPTSSLTSALPLASPHRPTPVDPDLQAQNRHQEPLQLDHPVQSLTTTPAWIADRIVVKEEPLEDKNNDSGISPGHYTSESASPHSRDSPSTTANCSLSPGGSSNASSQDSNHANMQMQMQMNMGYARDYSPQRHYKPCDSPLDYARNNHNEPTSPAGSPDDDDSLEDRHTLIPSDIVMSTLGSGIEEAENIEVSPDPLQCPICQFSTQSRLAFTDHLASHCTIAAKSDTSEFTKSVMEQLTNNGSIGSPEELSRASPTQTERNSEHESEEADEPGLRVPRVNSQGKVKTFRCKQCNFVAITKLDFWEHSRCHIKAEKLLTCPKCPFVTEYKHHLEYHLRNHFGSKPYKCDKCSYSCVNKSMLNSHLKSHSNVYQFRCADCSYATKYCHSLKLHLRKYEHKPAMVLNADGSPNPLPIIDVYGTRRGPKTKPKKEHQERPIPQSQNGMVNSLVPTEVPQQTSPLNPLFQYNPLNGFPGFNGTSLPAPSGLIGFPYNQLFGGFSMPNPFAMNNGSGHTDEPNDQQQMERMKINFMEYAKMNMNNAEAKIPEEFPQGNFNQGVNGVTFNNPELYTEVSTTTIDRFDEAPISLVSGVTIKQEKEPELDYIESNPLDLSKPVASVVATNSPKCSGTSRRKGRAVKLDRRVMENDSDEEMPEEAQQNGADRYGVSSPSTSPTASTDSKDSKDSTSFAGAVGMSNEFACQYCEISFGNEVMHSVHMGYHGYQNPYTCNMCGIQCTDKVSFFLHIARVKH